MVQNVRKKVVQHCYSIVTVGFDRILQLIVFCKYNFYPCKSRTVRYTIHACDIKLLIIVHSQVTVNGFAPALLYKT